MVECNYRVVRRESEDGSDEWYSVQEVFYDDKGKPNAYSIDLQVEGDTITEMSTQLGQMLIVLDDAVLDEGDIVEDSPDTIEDKVTELEMENAELRDRLTELGEEMEERGL